MVLSLVRSIHVRRALFYPIILALPSAAPGEEPAPPRAAAFAGQPLGVASARFEVPDPADVPAGEERFSIAGDHRRVLYPVFLPDPTPAGPAGRAGGPPGFEVLFLFPGTEPLTVVATTNIDRSPYREFRATAAPRAAPAGDAARRRELRRWWRAYRQLLTRTARSDLCYPVIENYLLWHLPRRLDLEEAAAPPEPPAARPLGTFPEVERLIDLLAGTESIRIALQRDTLLEGADEGAEAPTVPLPSPPDIRPVELPAHPEGVLVEPMAHLVPAECLYIRFPRFSDFQAVRGAIEAWGSSLHDLILGRSFDAGAREILETQLALRETTLGRLFGDLAIGELALVASDTFVREGSALGILFEVKNEPLFRGAIEGLRREAVAESKAWPGGGAREEEVEIGGARVKLLEAPGNRIRSFHAASGRFQLITNCRRLVERFLACARGDGASLARDPGYLHARALHPLESPQNALAFISDPFLRELIGPAYRAEMTRRTRSRSRMELVEVARRVARAETGRDLPLAALAAEGYLPAGIGSRLGGSGLADTAAGVADTHRGLRGTFLPVPDAGVTALTPSEARAYQEFARFYRQKWERVDPAVIRVTLDEDRDCPGGPGAPPGCHPPGGDRVRLVVDILPFAREPYQALRAGLGAPGMRTLDPLPGEILAVEAELGALVSSRRPWVAAGIIDFERPLVLEGGASGLLADPGRVPAYLILPITERPPEGGVRALFLSARPEPGGMHAIEGGILGMPAWAREAGERLVISTRRETADLVAGALRFGEGDRAQARLRLGSLRERRAGSALRAETWERARRASLSAAALLSTLHGVLKVPIEECEGEVARILAASVACPSGARFRGNPYPQGGGLFFSSDGFRVEGKSAAERARIAEGFPNPVLDRLEGLRVSLTLSGRSLHSEVTARVRRAD